MGKQFRVQESDPDHRLPKLNYHTMKEKQIRELLSQAELGTTGDKNVLMARHQQCGFTSSVLVTPNNIPQVDDVI